MADQPSERPKIIVDEDWKSRAQAEKEALAQEAERKKADEVRPEQPRHELPPATFAVHVSTLVSEALIFLGQMPHPLTGKPEVDLPQAKHFIDTLQMLEEKTKGNLTVDEAQMLEQVVHELRMAYVTIGNRMQRTAE
jgi:hypothetical protein